MPWEAGVSILSEEWTKGFILKNKKNETPQNQKSSKFYG